MGINSVVVMKRKIFKLKDFKISNYHSSKGFNLKVVIFFELNKLSVLIKCIFIYINVYDIIN